MQNYDFPDGPLAKTPCMLPVQGAWILHLVRELDSQVLQLRAGNYKLLSHVRLFSTPWTIQPEYWSG